MRGSCAGLGPFHVACGVNDTPSHCANSQANTHWPGVRKVGMACSGNTHLSVTFVKSPKASKTTNRRQMTIIRCINCDATDLNKKTRSLAHAPSLHPIHQLHVETTRHPASDHFSPPAPTLWLRAPHRPLLLTSPCRVLSLLQPVGLDKRQVHHVFCTGLCGHQALHTGPHARLRATPTTHCGTLDTQQAPRSGP